MERPFIFTIFTKNNILMASNTLINHFKHTRQNLITLSKHLDIVKHGDIKGLGREAFISQFLKANLPSEINFVTGEIIDSNDLRSNQIDVILQSFSSPKIPIFENIQVSLSDTVISVIEIKSKLTTGSWQRNNHLKLALENFESVKSLKRSNLIPGSITHRPHPNTPCVLVAYSGPTYEKLIQKLVDYHTTFNKSFDTFAPDLVIVLDRGYAIARNDGWISKKVGNQPFILFNNDDNCLVPLFVYLCKLIEVWNSKKTHTKFQLYF